MTVAELTPTIAYLENGVTLAFPVHFRFLPHTLTAERVPDGGTPIVLVEGADYAVTGGDTDAGGTLTLVSSMAGATLFIGRDTPVSQEMDYDTADTFPAESHEDALDKLTLILQEQKAGLHDLESRALRVPIGEEIDELPPADERAQGILGFDGDGEPIIIPTVDVGGIAVTAQRREHIATAGQASFATNVEYQVGYLGVYVNGVRLSEQEFTATDGINAVLHEPAAAGDVVLLEGFLGADVDSDAKGMTFTQAGSGADTRTVESKLRDIVHLFDFVPPGEVPAIVAGTSTYDATADLAAAMAATRELILPHTGKLIVSQIVIPPTLYAMRGSSKGGLVIKHKAGAAGAMWKWSGVRHFLGRFVGVYLEGNGEAAETCGFDLTGFSYATFDNCRARLFKQDGWYSKGLITPTLMQMSNNTFVNCIGNESGRDGIRLEGASPLLYENTANIFIGGTFSGNAGWGIYGDVCEKSQWIGTSCELNAAGDVWFNCRFAKFEGYLEGTVTNNVQFGIRSKGCEVKARTSFPMWQTFVDNGEANKHSIMGEYEQERHLFFNPYFADWVAANPGNVAPLGAPLLTSYADANSPMGAGLQVTINASFQGLELALGISGAAIQGRWATLILEMDTSGVIDPLGLRIYARDGVTGNGATGAFVLKPLPITAPAGKFETFAFDVKFADAVAGAPNIALYLGYDGGAGPNPIKLRSARVVVGQNFAASWPVLDPLVAASATQADILNKAMGLNIHRKRPGRTIFNTTNGSLYYPLGTAPVSAWRATNGSGDLVPV